MTHTGSVPQVAYTCEIGVNGFNGVFEGKECNEDLGQIGQLRKRLRRLGDLVYSS
jgi:hypothetical protein